MPVTLKIFSGGAMRPLLSALLPLFERDSGIQCDARYALSSVLMKDIAEGAAFDVALLPRPDLDALVQTGRIMPGTQQDVARSTVGLCVRSGAPRPDISTVDAFRRALLSARSISYSDGPSGAYIGSLLERLGVAAEMAAKTHLTSAPVGELIARGEAELGMQQIVAILPVKGAELVGPLPSELQNVIVYAAGTAAQSGQPTASRALTAFFTSAQAAPRIRAIGLEPG